MKTGCGQRVVDEKTVTKRGWRSRKGSVYSGHYKPFWGFSPYILGKKGSHSGILEGKSHDQFETLKHHAGPSVRKGLEKSKNIN